MLRLGTVRLFWAERDVIEMHHFMGTSLGQARREGSIGRRKIACTWDMRKQVPAISETKQSFSLQGTGVWQDES